MIRGSGCCCNKVRRPRNRIMSRELRREKEQQYREEDLKRRREEDLQSKMSAVMNKLANLSEQDATHTVWRDRITGGTCEWILEDEAFKRWKDASQGCLWLYGRRKLEPYRQRYRMFIK